MSAAEYLHDSRKFAVAPYYCVKLAVGGAFCKISAISIEEFPLFLFVFGRFVVLCFAASFSLAFLNGFAAFVANQFTFVEKRWKIHRRSTGLLVVVVLGGQSAVLFDHFIDRVFHFFHIFGVGRNAEFLINVSEHIFDRQTEFFGASHTHAFVYFFAVFESRHKYNGDPFVTP